MIWGLACIAYDLAMLAVLKLQGLVDRAERSLTRAGDRWSL